MSRTGRLPIGADLTMMSAKLLRIESGRVVMTSWFLLTGGTGG